MRDILIFESRHFLGGNFLPRQFGTLIHFPAYLRDLFLSRLFFHQSKKFFFEHSERSLQTLKIEILCAAGGRPEIADGFRDLSQFLRDSWKPFGGAFQFCSVPRVVGFEFASAEWLRRRLTASAEPFYLPRRFLPYV